MAYSIINEIYQDSETDSMLHVRGQRLEVNSEGGNSENVDEVDNISPNIPSLLNSAAHGDK